MKHLRHLVRTHTAWSSILLQHECGDRRCMWRRSTSSRENRLGVEVRQTIATEERCVGVIGRSDSRLFARNLQLNSMEAVYDNFAASKAYFVVAVQYNLPDLR